MKLKAEYIKDDNFSQFGTVLDPFNCGSPLGGGSKTANYYPDKMFITSFSNTNLICINPLHLRKGHFVFNMLEYHRYTEETMGGFNEDIIFHVTPEDKFPDLTKTKAFILPKNFWFRIKTGVWHFCPFAVNDKDTLGYCLLPPFAYTNDTVLVDLNKEIEIDY